jgi:hypothetical protein
MTDTTTKTAVALLEKALRRAFALGQDYWADADSESYSANRRADDRRQKFETLVSETLASLAAQPQAEPVAADECVLVPVTPTPAMLEAAVQAICYGPEGGFTRINGPTKAWSAMLAARPPVAQQGAAEAVGWVSATDLENLVTWSDGAVAVNCAAQRTASRSIPLYAAPVAASQPVAQGLTDEQCDEIMTKAMHEKRGAAAYDFIRAGYAAALSTAHPAQAAPKASADEGGV